eukprot:sb/3465442/
MTSCDWLFTCFGRSLDCFCLCMMCLIKYTMNVCRLARYEAGCAKKNQDVLFFKQRGQEIYFRVYEGLLKVDNNLDNYTRTFTSAVLWCIEIPSDESLLSLCLLQGTFSLKEPTGLSKQPIRTRYLGHVTDYQPVRDPYFLIRDATTEVEEGLGPYMFDATVVAECLKQQGTNVERLSDPYHYKIVIGCLLVSVGAMTMRKSGGARLLAANDLSAPTVLSSAAPREGESAFPLPTLSDWPIIKSILREFQINPSFFRADDNTVGALRSFAAKSRAPPLLRIQQTKQTTSLSLTSHYLLRITLSQSLLTACQGINQELTETSKQPIKTRYLGHVTGYQPIRDEYFLIRSVPVSSTEAVNFIPLYKDTPIYFHCQSIGLTCSHTTCENCGQSIALTE